jgi:hypothetical protein
MVIDGLRREDMMRCVLLILFLVTCQSCGDSKDAPSARHGDEPGTGAVSSVKPEGIGPRTPVEADTLTFNFQRFVIPSEVRQRAAEFSVSNGFNKGISAAKLTLLYQNSAGQMIGTFGWSISGTPVWIEAGATKTAVVGHRIPGEAATVDVVVREVTFSDGKSMSLEHKG